MVRLTTTRTGVTRYPRSAKNDSPAIKNAFCHRVRKLSKAESQSQSDERQWTSVCTFRFPYQNLRLFQVYSEVTNTILVRIFKSSIRRSCCVMLGYSSATALSLCFPSHNSSSTPVNWCCSDFRGNTLRKLAALYLGCFCLVRAFSPDAFTVPDVLLTEQ